MIQRRGFLAAMLAASAAPAIVKASSLMKITPTGLVIPEYLVADFGIDDEGSVSIWLQKSPGEIFRDLQAQIASVMVVSPDWIHRSLGETDDQLLSRITSTLPS